MLRALCMALAAAGLLSPAPSVALWPEAEEPPAQERPLPSWSAKERVAVRLAQSRALAGARIRTDEPAGGDGDVTLRGVVRDEPQRQRAIRIAARTPGVSRVDDALAVDRALAPPAPLSDEAIARSVAEALAADDTLDARVGEGWLFGWRVDGSDWSVEVEVDDGDVLLAGNAPLQQHIYAFILEAREVPGVRSVRSEIALRPNPEPADPVHSH
jgi:osmotically-inducible protein OsmY